MSCRGPRTVYVNINLDRSERKKLKSWSSFSTCSCVFVRRAHLSCEEKRKKRFKVKNFNRKTKSKREKIASVTKWKQIHKVFFSAVAESSPFVIVCRAPSSIRGKKKSVSVNLKNMPLFNKKPSTKASSPTNGVPVPQNGNEMHPMQQQMVPSPIKASPPPPSLVFHCQLANGSPTGLITGFSSVKELYQKIAECYDFSVDEVI